MGSRTIAQRELRNNIGEILREAEAGTDFTITVRGRPVARLVAADKPAARAVDVDAATIRRLLAETPVDEAFAAELAEMRRLEAPVGDPWPET